ncbi:MAG: ABC transporter permease [Acidobacteria bacterium]|nr:ABC transporter permease [Acidobacteriota bacterium]
MLAVGIGANAAVFTLTNGILFDGAPHIDPANRIVYIQTPQGVSYPDFEDWRAEAHSFDGRMAIVFSGGNRTLLDDQHGPREVYDATQLGANAFHVLGYRPIIGRDFTPSDEMPGALPVIILSHHLWERRYGKDPGIIGQTVRINSTPASWGAVDMVTSTMATIVGVMPPDFRFPMYRVDLWLPLVRTSGTLFPDVDDRQKRNFWFAFAHLADDATLDQARAGMQEIGRRLERTYPAANRGVVPSVKSFREAWLAPNVAALYSSMWAAVAFVLSCCRRDAGFEVAACERFSGRSSQPRGCGGRIGRGRGARLLYSGPTSRADRSCRCAQARIAERAGITQVGHTRGHTGDSSVGACPHFVDSHARPADFRLNSTHEGGGSKNRRLAVCKMSIG